MSFDVGPRVMCYPARGIAPIVVHALEDEDGDRAAQRSHLADLAGRWNVCLIEPREPEGIDGMLEIARAISDSLGLPGLVSFDPNDLARIGAAPSVGEAHAVGYVPGTGAWKLPEAVDRVVRDADRLFVLIRCGPETTLLDVNAICGAVGAAAAVATPILVGAPVAKGAPVVTVIAISRVRWQNALPA